MDRTIDFVGEPYYPGYGPFAEDLRVEPQIYSNADSTYVETGSSYNFVEDYWSSKGKHLVVIYYHLAEMCFLYCDL